MGIETFNYIDSLVNTNPTSTDNVSEGDNHIRGIKTALKNSLPNIDGAVTATDTELNLLDGVTTTTAQLNYLNTASSNVQSQLDAKLTSTTGVEKTATTGSAKLPTGTTAQRDGTPSAGYLRWNTTDTSAEVYDGSAWAPVGGGNTTDEGLYEMSNTISADYSITSGNNAVTAGPITVDSGVTVTVPSGSTWVIV